MEILRTPDERFVNLPGAKGQLHTTIVGAGHFLQEEKGPEFAQIIVDFLVRTA